MGVVISKPTIIKACCYCSNEIQHHFARQKGLYFCSVQCYNKYFSTKGMKK